MKSLRKMAFKILVLTFIVCMSLSSYGLDCDIDGKNLIKKEITGNYNISAYIKQDKNGDRYLHIDKENETSFVVKDLIPCEGCMGKDDYLDITDEEGDFFNITFGVNNLSVNKNSDCLLIEELSTLRKMTDDSNTYINPVRTLKTNKRDFGKVCLKEYENKSKVIQSKLNVSNKELDDEFKLLYNKIINEGSRDTNNLRRVSIISSAIGIRPTSYIQLRNLREVMSQQKQLSFFNNIESVIQEYFTTGLIVNKSYLHTYHKVKTKMYIIKGDKVTILDEETNDSGQKWYFINYKGKKDLNMWIREEAVDIPDPDIEESIKEIPSSSIQQDSPETSDLSINNKIKNIDIDEAKIVLPLENSTVSKISESSVSEQKQSAGGSLSLLTPLSIFGLLVFKLS